MNRRALLQNSFAAALAGSLPAFAQTGRKPRILLRNGWQSINIGDIAHPLGILELMEKNGIDAEVRFWASNLENGAGELIQKRFPKLIILEGQEQIDQAFKDCDFLLHGSGSGFVAQGHVAEWSKKTGKPYGIYGISFFDPKPGAVALLTGAQFVYFRESVSLKVAQDNGCKCPVMAFGPDSAFGVVTLRNDEAANAFLKASGLEEGKFLCCIPRYRWTPFWTVKKGRPYDEVKDARNKEKVEHDHAPHRDAIISVVRETGMKVLICCEDQTQIPLGKTILFDPLPEDVKAKVVWRDKYWLTDEALSVYNKSAGLFGNEMHSPIMCISSGIPAVVCRWDEQTTKGFMWRDIGLSEWLFTMDNEAEVSKIAPTVLAIAKDPAAAKAKAAKARDLVLKLEEDHLKVLEGAVKKAAGV
ncbi:MAG: polysaccharide pyruvyl transferase family protein [Verrucomicrobium sp.]